MATREERKKQRKEEIDRITKGVLEGAAKIAAESAAEKRGETAVAVEEPPEQEPEEQEFFEEPEKKISHEGKIKLISQKPYLKLGIRKATGKFETVIEGNEVVKRPVRIDNSIAFDNHVAWIDEERKEEIRNLPGYWSSYVFVEDFKVRRKSVSKKGKPTGRTWAASWRSQAYRHNQSCGVRPFPPQAEDGLAIMDEELLSED